MAQRNKKNSHVKKIGLVTGGGDCPGLNAVIRAVVISAIVDALSDYGVRDIRMPATPYNVWRTIEDAKARSGRT